MSKQQVEAPSESIEIIAADALVPKLERRPQDEAHWYWIGLTSDCPRESIDLAGISFPKVNALVSWIQSGKGILKPQVGCLIRLTRARVRAIAEAVSCRIVRFVGPAAEPGSGQDVGQGSARRQGILLRVPSADEIAEARRKGKRVREIDSRETDVPLASFVYMALLGGERPTPRGEFAVPPDPVAVTGIAVAPATMAPADPAGGVAYDDGKASHIKTPLGAPMLDARGRIAR
jgi:hypothetical protein